MRSSGPWAVVVQAWKGNGVCYRPLNPDLEPCGTVNRLRASLPPVEAGRSGVGVTWEASPSVLPRGSALLGAEAEACG